VEGFEASVFIHATEDEDKVLRGFGEVFPAGMGFKRTVLTGHYGNPIVKIEGRCKGRKAQEVFDRLVGRMERDDLREVTESLERKIDGSCHLYLRFCKQEALDGRLRLAGGDDVIHVKVKVAARPAKPDRAAKVLRDYLAGIVR